MAGLSEAMDLGGSIILDFRSVGYRDNLANSIAEQIGVSVKGPNMYPKKNSTLYITHCSIFKKKNCSLPVLCSPRLILTRYPQIYDQNKSEAREPEGLVKITYS